MKYSMRQWRAIGLGLVASLCLVACGGDDDGTTANAPVTPVTPVTPVNNTALSGTVLDDATGLGIQGVTVRVGSLTTTSAADGTFRLTGIAASGRTTVVFESSSYAEGARIANVVAEATTDVQARLVRVAASGDVPVAAGGTVALPGSPAQVTLPANGVRRADGSTPTGNITVRITPINPAIDTTLMPGDFLTSGSSGNVPIESFGAMNVTLTDSAGAALNLASGQTATIRIPLASRNASVPSTIPLFYFDTSTGLWKQEGSATLAGSGSSAYYEGTVSHFTTWNADQTYNTIIVHGCLKDAAGVLLANGLVASDGIDYTGTSTVYTDSSGNFSLPIRSGSIATIVAVNGGRLSNTVRNDPSTTDITLTDCLSLGQSGAGVTMKLTWGALPSDLDSHLITPSGAHVYYSSKGALVSVPFANLDVDDTSSYGPEVVTVTKLMVGTYKYSVRNYSGYGGGPIAQSGARVEVNMPGRALQLITPPTAGESASTNYWNLFEFDVSATCVITVRPVGTYTNDLPTIPTSSTPQYCTPV
ncbi:MAG: carboxypeptidase regulatory-like domain-containing protein [Rhodoferax sp.]|uniref:carboxypeptidase regulatory-like domain-containing protein n=1 Tax=Rhodoferax sp. TaxID=50421 RepID=UPI003264017C